MSPCLCVSLPPLSCLKKEKRRPVSHQPPPLFSLPPPLAQGVRDVWFSRDGSRFASTGYDRAIRVWDTETGAVLGKYGEGKMAYTVRIHPDEDKQNVLMAGTADKKIIQIDTDTGDVVQVNKGGWGG